MTVHVAINGFGRIGRLFLRAAQKTDAFKVVHINDLAADVETAAHLLQFDSLHGTWQTPISVEGEQLKVGDQAISYSSNRAIADTDWVGKGADVVVECTGQHKTTPALQPYFDAGLKKVVVSCPVKDGPLNIVMGVNDHLYDPAQHSIVTAASCTTNCLAPVVKVIHESFGIKRGSLTTIHDPTATQMVMDQAHKDLRRARAASISMIPTSTGSATAIGLIFPELQGKLNGLAVRVPVLNASLTDCVFDVERDTTVEEVNAALEQAAKGELDGILGYETRPLVSVDYKSDARSGIVDAPCTLVIDKRQVKLFVWYDNEMGYVHRLMELTAKVARGL